MLIPCLCVADLFCCRERAELERKYRGQLDVVEGRLSEVDAENRCLRELKFQLDSRVSELSHKLGAVEGTCQAAEAEVERLRALMQQLSRDKAERDVELGEALARVHALEDKVETQKGMVGEQAERIRGLEASLRQVEARAEELKAAAAGHEGRAREAAAEVAKGNATIEKLSADLQTVREKLRRKASVMSKQEEELAARDKAADDAVQSVRSLRRELEHSKEDAGMQRGRCLGRIKLDGGWHCQAVLAGWLTRSCGPCWCRGAAAGCGGAEGQAGGEQEAAAEQRSDDPLAQQSDHRDAAALWRGARGAGALPVHWRCLPARGTPAPHAQRGHHCIL